jgi:hypothetical protein
MHNVPTLLTKGIHRLVEQYGGDIHPVRLKPAESKQRSIDDCRRKRNTE